MVNTDVIGNLTLSDHEQTFVCGYKLRYKLKIGLIPMKKKIMNRLFVFLLLWSSIFLLLKQVEF